MLSPQSSKDDKTPGSVRVCRTLVPPGQRLIAVPEAYELGSILGILYHEQSEAKEKSPVRPCPYVHPGQSMGARNVTISAATIVSGIPARRKSEN